MPQIFRPRSSGRPSTIAFEYQQQIFPRSSRKAKAHRFLREVLDNPGGIEAEFGRRIEGAAQEFQMVQRPRSESYGHIVRWNKASGMTTKSLKVMVNGKVVGLMSDIAVDMPWFRALFEPKALFQEFEPLFKSLDQAY